MLAYKYNKSTREYIGQTIVMIDPLESQRLGKEVLAFPPNCTLIAPPEVQENEVAIFNEEKKEWEVSPDFRGSTIYSKKGNPSIVTEIGEIPTNYSLEKPVTLQEIKVEKIEEVKTLYNTLIEEVIESGDIKAKRSDKGKLLSALNNFGSHNLESYENPDGETVLVTKEDLEKAEKRLYIYQMLLAIKKSSLLSEIGSCTNKKNISLIEIKFDIEEELEELMKLSTEELDEHFAGEK